MSMRQQVYAEQSKVYVENRERVNHQLHWIEDLPIIALQHLHCTLISRFFELLNFSQKFIQTNNQKKNKQYCLC